MAGDRKAWEQLDNEPDEAYVRFLVYRNLGPARTLDLAYAAANVNKRKRSASASGQWREDSTTYHWRERAARWDVSQLSQVVPETAGLIFESIKEYARIVLGELQTGKHKPRKWAEVKDSLVTLAQFVSPEVITSAIDNAGAPGDDAGEDFKLPPETE